MDMFQRRVNRLNSGQIARNVIWVGSDEAYAMPERQRKVRSSGFGGVARNLLHPLSLLASVVLGFACHGLGLILRYHVQGLPDPGASPDMEMVVQVVTGLALAMVIGHFIGLRAASLTPLKSLGVAGGLVAFHNLVHAWPQVFATLASQIWVNHLTADTAPMSLVWRGIVIGF